MEPPNAIGSEQRFTGIPVAPGIAHCAVMVQWEEDEEIALRKIEPHELPEEIARFESALIATRAELLEIQQRIVKEYEAELERAKTPGYASRYDEIGDEDHRPQRPSAG